MLKDGALGLFQIDRPESGAARPDQLGHRERLRQRAVAAGLAALPDYELLELFLFRTVPRGEVKPLAKALLARFGTLAGVGAVVAVNLVRGRGEEKREERRESLSIPSPRCQVARPR